MNVNVLGCYVRSISINGDFREGLQKDTWDQMVFRDKQNAARPVGQSIPVIIGGRSGGMRTDKNIVVKIICIMVDVMYETPERDVFY